ncbi:hypothetical protein ACLBSQ_33645, partial [Klebsiella pneumoniae]
RHHCSHAGPHTEEPAGGSFGEACSVPWLRLSRLYPRAELPLACLATTVGLGGPAPTLVLTVFLRSSILSL